MMQWPFLHSALDSKFIPNLHIDQIFFWQKKNTTKFENPEDDDQENHYQFKWVDKHVDLLNVR